MRQLTFLVEYDFGETVYLKTDKDQTPRIVTGHLIDNNSVLYRVQCGTSCDFHYEIEISRAKNVLLTTDN